MSTDITYIPDEEPMVIPTQLFDMLSIRSRKAGVPLGNSLALYLLYYRAAKRYQTEHVWCSTKYCQKSLRIARHRIIESRSFLEDCGVIKQVRQYEKDHRGVRKYLIQILWKNSLEKALLFSPQKMTSKTFSPQLFTLKKLRPYITGNNIKNIREPGKCPGPLAGRAENVEKLVRAFYAYQRKQFPSYVKEPTEAQFNTACSTVEKLVRIDKLPFTDIRDALRWAVRDEFWARNILSPAALRSKCRNGSTKMVTILLQWRAKALGSYQTARMLASPLATEMGRELKLDACALDLEIIMPLKQWFKNATDRFARFHTPASVARAYTEFVPDYFGLENKPGSAAAIRFSGKVWRAFEAKLTENVGSALVEPEKGRGR